MTENLAQEEYGGVARSPKEMEGKVEKFREIWDKITERTKKDIKLSISLFENFESFDLALFPMIRSLEYEFSVNYFVPFHRSQIYKNLTSYICINRYYDKTHDALIERSHYPTLGNIIFIGKSINDTQAQQDSNVIKAFDLFLRYNKNFFKTICTKINNFKVGSQQYRLIDIRNGIAHGNDNIINNIYRKCYEEISKLLYEPPLQILFELVRHSMK